MRSTPMATRNWLYTGEPFVVDEANRIHGQSMPTDYTVRILRGRQPVPFALIPVDGPNDYPSVDDIETMAPSAFARVAEVSFPKGKPINYTLAVPADAFPDKRAYHLHVLYIPKIPPGKTDAYSHDHPFSRTHTIYYESESFGSGAEERPSRDGRVSEWTKLERNYVGYHDGMFLAPSLEIYDWMGVDAPTDADSGRVFEVSSPETTLQLRTVGMTSNATASSERNLYVVVRGTEIVETFFGTPATNFDEGQWTDQVERGSSFRINVPVRAEPAVYQVVVFPAPSSLQDPSVDQVATPSNMLSLTQESAQ